MTVPVYGRVVHDAVVGERARGGESVLEGAATLRIAGAERPAGLQRRAGARLDVVDLAPRPS